MTSLQVAEITFGRSPPDEAERKNKQVLGSAADATKKPFAAFILWSGL